MSPDFEPDVTEPPGPRGTWMISFVDLISVLLTFMVMLYAMSDAREAPVRHGTDSLAETIDWHRELPTRAARNGSEAVRSPPAMDLDYLQGVLETALADEPVRPGIVRRDDRLIVALTPPAGVGTASAEQAPPLGEAERRMLRTLARPLNSVGNRLEVDALTILADAAGSAGATATPPAAAWAAAIGRATAAAAVLAEAGLERPVGCYGLADLPAHRLPVEARDPRQPPASRIRVVVLAGAGE